MESTFSLWVAHFTFRDHTLTLTTASAWDMSCKHILSASTQILQTDLLFPKLVLFSEKSFKERLHPNLVNQSILLSPNRSRGSSPQWILQLYQRRLLRLVAVATTLLLAPTLAWALQVKNKIGFLRSRQTWWPDYTLYHHAKMEPVFLLYQMNSSFRYSATSIRSTLHALASRLLDLTTYSKSFTDPRCLWTRAETDQTSLRLPGKL